MTGSSPTLRQAVVLAGGRATRLGALAAETPKPLLPCGDRPFLAWLLRELVRYGVADVVLLAGHLAPRLAESLPDIAARLPRPLALRLSVEPTPAGTAGALWHARGLLDERFLLVNGDSLLDANLAPLLAAAAADDPRHVLARLAVHEMADTGRYGVVTCDGDRIVAFAPRGSGAGLISAGIYVLHRRIIPTLPSSGSLEADVLPMLAAQGALRATTLRGWFIDIGIPADLARAQAHVPARLRRRALFLDRDGVINRDLGYVGSRDRFIWINGARAAIRAATEAGWHIFVATNQSGVARGLFDEAAVESLHTWMTDEVRRAGGTIDDIRFCPYHPAAPLPAYRRASAWRKPAPGMLLDLMRAWEVDPARAVMIGDQPTDLAAAAAAGIRATLFNGDNLLATVNCMLN